MVMVDANNDVQKKSKRGLRMPYELLCVSAIGSSHVGAGTVKEDFGAVYDGGFYKGNAFVNFFTGGRKISALLADNSIVKAIC